MLTGEQQADVQHVLRLRNDNRFMLRDLTKNWTTEHFEYAEQRLPIDIGYDVTGRLAMDVIRELGKERVATEHRQQDAAFRKQEAEFRQQEAELAKQRHAESMTTDRRTLRVACWTLGISLLAILATIVAWLFPRTPS